MQGKQGLVLCRKVCIGNRTRLCLSGCKPEAAYLVSRTGQTHLYCIYRCTIWWRNLSLRIPLSFFLVKSSSIIRCLALLDHHELGFLTRKAAVTVLCFLQSSFLAVTFRAPNQPLSAPVFSLFPALYLPTVPVSPPLPWKTKKPSSSTNPIQLHPLRPVRFFPVLPSIDLALRRPGASSNRSGVCSVVLVWVHSRARSS